MPVKKQIKKPAVSIETVLERLSTEAKKLEEDVHTDREEIIAATLTIIVDAFTTPEKGNSDAD